MRGARKRAAIVVLVAIAILPARAGAVAPPGASGIGDPYYPYDGNGGYEVVHYDLDLAWDPATSLLNGTVTITANVLADLSTFDLDRRGGNWPTLRIRSITVDGAPAAYAGHRNDLTVRPQGGVHAGQQMVVVVTYVHRLFGWEDGVTTGGGHHGASSVFPANDHPRDRATFTTTMTVPEGLEVIATGALLEHTDADGQSTWVWDQPEAVSPTEWGLTIGQYDLHTYEEGGLAYLDAVDSALYAPMLPRSGAHAMYTQRADSAWKRLSRTLTIPAEGARLSFWANAKIDGSEYFFLEARTPGEDDWTTLPTADDSPAWMNEGYDGCYFADVHRFFEHYTSYDDSIGSCTPTGTTGEFWANSGGGPTDWEQYVFDLSAFVGGDVEVAITFATDAEHQTDGIAIDDVEVSTGEGSTSFEDDADPLDGWQVPGPPAESPGNVNDWIRAAAADAPQTHGAFIDEALTTIPDTIAFLETVFGPYPFSTTGSIVDMGALGPASTQDRTIYDDEDFYADFGFDFGVPGSMFVHDQALKWCRANITLRGWKHSWLVEGCATYAQWLWEDHEGLDADIEHRVYAEWDDTRHDPLRIGDPGKYGIYEPLLATRAAIVFHRLRVRVGEDAFAEILRQWTHPPDGQLATTGAFRTLAESVSGLDLHRFFDAWLFQELPPRLPNPPE